MALFYPDIILWDDLQMPPILLECIYGKNEFAYLLSRLLLRSPTGGDCGHRLRRNLFMRERILLANCFLNEFFDEQRENKCKIIAKS